MLTAYNPATRALGRLALRGAGARAFATSNPALMARTAWAAARTIGRAYRYYRRYKRKRGTYNGRINMSMRGKKRARFSTKMIGMPAGSTSSKSALIQNTTGIVRNSRVLYTLDLTAVQQGVEINQRLRQHAKISGWKICMEVSNTITRPLYFNWAVISPKSTGQSGGNAPDPANFFRDNTQARSMDFSNGRSALEFHCCPINSDDYTILKHKRFVLQQPSFSSGAWNRQYGSAFINIDRYIRLKRQTRYLPGESTTATDGRVFLVYWYDPWGYASGVGSGPVASESLRVITYFREPRN